MAMLIEFCEVYNKSLFAITKVENLEKKVRDLLSFNIVLYSLILQVQNVIVYILQILPFLFIKKYSHLLEKRVLPAQ